MEATGITEEQLDKTVKVGQCEVYFRLKNILPQPNSALTTDLGFSLIDALSLPDPAKRPDRPAKRNRVFRRRKWLRKEKLCLEDRRWTAGCILIETWGTKMEIRGNHTRFNPVATQNAVTFGHVTPAAYRRIFQFVGRLRW